MRRLVILLFIFLSLPVMATNYYVATDGNDSNDGLAGDAAHAWLTFQKAVNTAVAGDIVYIRGGTYTLTDWVWLYPAGSRGHDGTPSNPIVYRNYPDEVPVFDGQFLPGQGTVNYAFYSLGGDYFQLRGLVFKNVVQKGNNYSAAGVIFYGAKGIRVDSCIVHNVGGHGFSAAGSCDSVFYYNCDSYNNADTLQIAYPGNTADGFNAVGTVNIIGYYGCRAWRNSDDGFDRAGGSTIIYNSCWAWDNGQLSDGNGNGFKYGLTNVDAALSVRIVNCISVYNRFSGFNANNPGWSRMNMQVFNNIAYMNGRGTEEYAYGFMDWIPTNNLDNENIYRNNISYSNISGNYFGSTYIHSNNTWDIPITVADADFLSVDSAGLGGARQANGNLPVLTFLHLTDAQLNGVGIGVGLTYDGDSLYHNDPPDLGPFAYSAVTPEPPEYPQVTTASISAYNSFRATTGGGGIVTPQGTIAVKGVCWSTSINPTIANSKTNDGTGTDDYASEITGLSSGTTYHIRAYVTDGAAQTSYGADIPLTTPSVNYLQSGGKFLYDPATGKLLKR